MTVKFLKRAVLCLSVFVVAWIAAIAWWSSTRQIPGTTQAFVYLFALPVAIICGSILALRSRTASPSAGESGTGTALAGASEQNNAPNAQQARATRATRATITHLAMRTAQGNSAAAVDTALAQSARASLDTTLVDDQGFPVRAARVATLHQEDLEALHEIWQAQYRHLPLAEKTLRAIALIEEVVVDMASELGHVALVSPLPGVKSRVQFDVIVDPDWDNAFCAALAQHLRTRALQESPHLRIDVTPVRGHTAASALAQVDLAIKALGHGPIDAGTTDTARWYVVAAMHSSLDSVAVADALRAGRLFTPSNQNGEIAGESATAIALSAGTQQIAASQAVTDAAADNASTDAQTDKPIAIIARPALTQRDAADTEGTQESGALLEATASRAIELAGLAADSIGGVVADKGSQSAHAVELALFAGSRFPHLEPLINTVALDGGCGATRAAGALLAVALAAHRAQERGQPVLSATLSDGGPLSAVVVLPAVHA